MWIVVATGGRLIEKTRKFQCVGITTTFMSVPSRSQKAQVVFVAIETMPITLARVSIFEKYGIQL